VVEAALLAYEQPCGSIQLGRGTRPGSPWPRDDRRLPIPTQ